MIILTYFFALLVREMFRKADTASLFLFFVLYDMTVGCKDFFIKRPAAACFSLPIVYIELFLGVGSVLTDAADLVRRFRIESVANSFF